MLLTLHFVSAPLISNFSTSSSPPVISAPPPALGEEEEKNKCGEAMVPILVAAVQVLAGLVGVSEGQGLVPGVIIFGDSTVDVGNNNHLLTLVKANFPPYGRDFPHHSPTGRFCNGKLVTDFVVEVLGFTTHPPAYLSKEATGNNLLNGANFASASSGYLDATASLYQAVSLTRQLRYFEQYQAKVKSIAGKATATALFADSIYVLSAGSSDFLQNYYINPLLRAIYSPDQFSGLLLQSFTTFVQELHDMGARRIGVTSLPPIGCLPAAITLFGGGDGDGDACVARLNDDAVAFNEKLDAAARALKRNHADLKLVVFDVYGPLLKLIRNPADGGFLEARRACCGTGTIETSLLCNAASPGTCGNATGYVFWDSFHPSEAANSVLADALIIQGIDLIL
uniref:Uncharacterized protein n=1 Tax=Musa acuminata subsp. malaccensis TaxID=214687 RepID=A0A804I2R1_MUSAM|nr:PREDICTED: GDSL esterase/lipase At5g03810-like isoform X2 [Musa acuminata subsp. malaccensis]